MHKRAVGRPHQEMLVHPPVVAQDSGAGDQELAVVAGCEALGRAQLRREHGKQLWHLPLRQPPILALLVGNVRKRQVACLGLKHILHSTGDVICNMVNSCRV